MANGTITRVNQTDGQSQLVARPTGDTGYTLITAYTGMPVYTGDTIETSLYGSVTVTMSDQSLLSIGNNSDLTVTDNNATSMQNWIEMFYGEIRSWVSQYTRDGGDPNARPVQSPGDCIGTLTYPDGSSTDLSVSGDWAGYDYDSYTLYDPYYDSYYDYYPSYGGGGGGCVWPQECDL